MSHTFGGEGDEPFDLPGGDHGDATAGLHRHLREQAALESVAHVIFARFCRDRAATQYVGKGHFRTHAAHIKRMLFDHLVGTKEERWRRHVRTREVPRSRRPNCRARKLRQFRVGVATGLVCAITHMPNPAGLGALAATLIFIPIVGPVATFVILTVVGIASQSAKSLLFNNIDRWVF